MSKIIVIQCSNGKQKNAGSFGGGKIKFEAHPEPGAKLTYHPDKKIPDMEVTWRDYVMLYNQKVNNPDELLPAAKLYKNKMYQKIIDEVGIKNVYILSAGWGLIRGDYLIPKYDITFSGAAKKKNRRKKNDLYNDFNQLPKTKKEVHFFGGKDYLELFYTLTKDIAPKCNITIHHASETEKHPEYNYEKWPVKCTNWHYQAVKDFL